MENENCNSNMESLEVSHYWPFVQHPGRHWNHTRSTRMTSAQQCAQSPVSQSITITPVMSQLHGSLLLKEEKRELLALKLCSTALLQHCSSVIQVKLQKSVTTSVVTKDLIVKAKAKDLAAEAKTKDLMPRSRSRPRPRCSRPWTPIGLRVNEVYRPC